MRVKDSKHFTYEIDFQKRDLRKINFFRTILAKRFAQIYFLLDSFRKSIQSHF